MGNPITPALTYIKNHPAVVISILALAVSVVGVQVNKANLRVISAKEARESAPKATLVLQLSMGDADGVVVGSANLIDLEAENTLNRFQDFLALNTVATVFGKRLVNLGILTEEKFKEGTAKAEALETELGRTEVGVPINLSISNNSEIDTTVTEVRFELKSLDGEVHPTTISGNNSRIEVPAGKTVDFEGDLFRYFKIHLGRLSPILMDSLLSTLGEGGSPVKKALMEKERHVFWDFSTPLRVTVVDQFGTEKIAELSGKEVEALIKKAFKIDK